MQEINKTNKVKVSPNQRILMFNFMKAHTDFARGRLTGPDGARQRQKKCEEMTKMLNACGSGATKTPKKWLKCWQDWRCDTKAKAIKIEKFMSGTIGGPCPPALSKLEESLIDFCSREMVAGVPEIEDPLEIQHLPAPQEEGPTLDEESLHEEALLPEEDSWTEDVPTKKVKKSKELNELLERQYNAIEKGFADMAAALKEVTIRDQQKNTITDSPVADSDENDMRWQSEDEAQSVRVKAERSRVREESSKRFRRAYVRGRTSRHSRTSSSSSTFENWLISLERRRVAAEEKTAAALKTMADAALLNAQTLRLVAEAGIRLKSDLS